MKTKMTALLGLAIALSLPVGAMFSAIATAQTSPPPAREGRPYEKRGQEHWEKWAAELNLTPEQQAQLQRIRQTTRQQMEAVFTPEQKAQMAAARQQGEKPRQVMAGLNVTEEQKAQMRQIRESSRQQMEAVLTPEQRQKLQTLRQQRPKRMQQGRMQRGGASSL